MTTHPNQLKICLLASMASTIWMALLPDVWAGVRQNETSSSSLTSSNSTSIPSIQSRIRISWGGGTAKKWTGHIRFYDAEIYNPAVLGIGTDSAAAIFVRQHQIEIRQHSVSSFEGVDVDFSGNRDAKIVVELFASDGSEPVVHEFLISQVIGHDQVVALDNDNNRISITRCPGDQLRIETDRKHLVFEPDEKFAFEFHANQLKPGSYTNECLIEIVQARGQGRAEFSKTEYLQFDENHSTQAITQTIPVPAEEGVYNLRLTIRSPSGLPIRINNRQHSVIREIQFVVIDQRPKLKAHKYDKIIAEIDPTHLRSALPHQFNQFSRMVGINNSSQTIGTFGIAPDLNAVELPVGGWQAIPISVNEAGQPYVLEIEYPVAEPMSLGFSILQPDETGQIPGFGFDSGFDLQPSVVESANEKNTQTHRFEFWPNSKNIILLIANRNQKRRGVYNKVRIFQRTDHPGSFKNTSVSNERTQGDSRKLMSFYEQPLFTENFAVDKYLDPGLNQSVNDWNSFYDATIRLAQFLKDQGSGGAFVNVFGEGSSLMPLESTNTSPRFDSGLFSSLGHDPVRKDVVEMMFRIFEREGLQLVPVLSFDQRLAEIEFEKGTGNSNPEAVDFQNDIAVSDVTREVPVYNPLHPDVQDVVSQIVGEVSDRYRGFRSFNGISIVCRPDSYTILPGSRIAGFDRKTMEQFSAAHPIQSRDEIFSTENFPKWLNWRAQQMERWYSRLQSSVSNGRTDLKLYLALVDVFRNDEVAALLSPSLHREIDVNNAMLRLGLRRDLLSSPGLVLMQPNRYAPVHSLVSRKSEFAIQRTQQLDDWFDNSGYSASLFSHRSAWARFENLEGSQFLAKQSAPILRLQQLNPAGTWNLERFANSVLKNDSRLLVDGGLLLNTCVDEAMLKFMETYSSLPDKPFQPIGHKTHAREIHPIATRFAQHNGSTYLYCVNGSPWEITATVAGDINSADRWELLADDSPSDKVVARPDSFQFQLNPFELVALRIESTDVRFKNFKYRLPETAQRDLNSAYYKLRSRLVASGNAQPINVLKDPGFEQGDINNGWTTGSQEPNFLVLKRSTAFEGRKYLRFENNSDQSKWIRSNQFAPPVTGRLSVSVWLRADSQVVQPPLRISVESSDPGSNYYRFAEVGSLTGDRKHNQLTGQWKRFAVHFDDIPLEKLAGLRVGFDMMGSGNVSIDDVQVFDRWMDDVDLKILTQMFASIGPLLKQPEKMERCRQILAGYWPTFLQEYFDEGSDNQNITASEQQQPSLRSSMRKRFRRFVSPGIFQFR